MNQKRQNKNNRRAAGSAEKRNKKLNGFLALYRREILLLKERKLKNLAEFGARVALLLLADWDDEHDTFGCVPSNTKLQQLTGMDHSRWSRYRRRFIKNGLLQEHESGQAEIPYFWKYHPRAAKQLSKVTFADTQEEAAFLQNQDAITQTTSAKEQNTRGNTSNGAPKNLGSLIAKTGKHFAFSQTSRPPKETQRKSKEKIKNLMKYDPKDVQYKCEKCGTAVLSFAAQLVAKRTTRKICMACYLRNDGGASDAAANVKPSLS